MVLTGRFNQEKQYLRFRLVLLLALGLVLGAAHASAADRNQVLTIKWCVETALEKSPAMRSAEKSVEGAEWQKKKAFTRFLPTLSAQYSYTQLDKEPAASLLGQTIQQGLIHNWNLTATLTQPLFTGFAVLSQYKLAELGLDVAEIMQTKARMDLVLQVKQAYFSVLQAQKGLEVARQSVKQLKAHAKVARNFFEVGMVPKNHVLQAEVQMAQARQNAILAKHQLRFAKASLNTLLRRDLEAPLEIEDVSCREPINKALPECVKRALESRPEVQAARRKIEMSRQSVTLAKSEYYPSVALIYNQIKEGDTPAVDGSAFHEPNSWNVTAMATWNFWEWGRTRDQVQTSRTEEVKAEQGLLQVEDGIRLEVELSYLSLRAAEKNISVAGKAVKQAEENYRMSEERYREQVATSTEVMDAETLLTTAKNNHYRALYQFCLAQAGLERAMGEKSY